MVELYNADEMEKSIFKAQKSFLTQLQLGIPSGIDQASASVASIGTQAEMYAEEHLRGFGRLIDKHDIRLGTTVVNYLGEHVYQPAKDALDFLFDRSDGSDGDDAGIGALKSCRLPSDQLVTEIRTLIANKQTGATEELEQIGDSWSSGWAALSSDFDVLIEEALAVVAKLRTRSQNASVLITTNRQQGLDHVRVAFANLRNMVLDLAEQHKDDAQKAARAAKRRSRWQTAGEIVVLLLSITKPVLDIIRSGFQIQALQAPTFIPWAIGGAILATWMVTLLVRTNETTKALIKAEFEASQNRLMQDVEKAITGGAASMHNELTKRNMTVRDGLRGEYDGLIKDAEDANRTLLERLDNQIQATATSGMEKTEQVAKVEKQATSAILRVVNSYLDQRGEEAAGAVERNLNDFVETVSGKYITLLKKQISRYTELANRIQRLKQTLAGAFVSEPQ